MPDLLRSHEDREILKPNVESTIVANHLMTFEEAETLRSEGGHDYAIIYDTNPGCTDETLEPEKARHPCVLLFDHHGPSSDPERPELTATEILFEELERKDGKLVRIMKEGKKILTVTNKRNLDPDGIISRFILEHPEEALRQKDLLLKIAHYTDHEIFGGEKFTKSYNAEVAPRHKKIGWTIMQMIVDGFEKLVDDAMRKNGTLRYPTTESDAAREFFNFDDTKSVFLENKNTKYTPTAVNSIYGSIISELPDLLQEEFTLSEKRSIVRQMLKKVYPSLSTTKPVRKYQQYVQRLKDITDSAEPFITIHRGRSGAPLFAEFRPPERPDKKHKIYDWLACGAATAAMRAPEVPLLFSFDPRTASGVISVPYAAQKQDSRIFDMRPLAKILHEKEVERLKEMKRPIRTTPPYWSARQQVAFSSGMTVLKPEEIRQEILANESLIVRGKTAFA